MAARRAGSRRGIRSKRRRASGVRRPRGARGQVTMKSWGPGGRPLSGGGGGGGGGGGFGGGEGGAAGWAGGGVEGGGGGLGGGRRGMLAEPALAGGVGDHQRERDGEQEQAAEDDEGVGQALGLIREERQRQHRRGDAEDAADL